MESRTALDIMRYPALPQLAQFLKRSCGAVTVLEEWKKNVWKKILSKFSEVNESALDDPSELWDPFYEADGNFLPMIYQTCFLCLKYKNLQILASKN